MTDLEAELLARKAYSFYQKSRGQLGIPWDELPPSERRALVFVAKWVEENKTIPEEAGRVMTYFGV